MSMSMERLEEALAKEEATNVQLRTRIAELEAEKNIRNTTLDEIATKIEKMPFGDTAASFAVWIREQKTKTCPPCHGDCNQGRTCPARG